MYNGFLPTNAHNNQRYTTLHAFADKSAVGTINRPLHAIGMQNIIHIANVDDAVGDRGRAEVQGAARRIGECFEDSAVRGAHREQVWTRRNEYHTRYRGDCRKYMPIIETILPEEVACGWIELPYAARTIATVDGCILTRDIEIRAIRGCGCDLGSATERAITIHTDGLFPDRTAIDVVAVKSVIDAILVHNTGHICRIPINGSFEERGGRTKIAIGTQLRFRHGPAGDEGEIRGIEFKHRDGIWLGTITGITRHDVHVAGRVVNGRAAPDSRAGTAIGSGIEDMLHCAGRGI